MHTEPDIRAAERHADDLHQPEAHGDGEGPLGARSIGRALRRGWRKRCPNCGGGPIFDRYLHVRDECMVCGEPLSHHRADDMPAWITILVVGHMIVPMLLLVNDYWGPPIWVHMLLWPVMVLGLTLLLLPRFKAVVVGLQWATRMGGFDDARAARKT
jgi:uncharacterized protein (DUF983 family)